MKQYCLKVGTKYSNEDVFKLAEQVGQLTVITDDVSLFDHFDIIKADDTLPTVWNKMRLFDEKAFAGAGIFYDLDIKILKPVGDLLQPQEYMTILHTDWEDLEKLANNTFGDRYKYCSINSSIMCWNEETKRQLVWDQFVKDKNKALRLFNGIDPYLEHRHSQSISFLPEGIVGSYRCNPTADVYIMSYDGEGKKWFTHQQ